MLRIGMGHRETRVRDALGPVTLTETVRTDSVFAVLGDS